MIKLFVFLLCFVNLTFAQPLGTGGLLIPDPQLASWINEKKPQELIERFSEKWVECQKDKNPLSSIHQFTERYVKAVLSEQLQKDQCKDNFSPVCGCDEEKQKTLNKCLFNVPIAKKLALILSDKKMLTGYLMSKEKLTKRKAQDSVDVLEEIHRTLKIETTAEQQKPDTTQKD